MNLKFVTAIFLLGLVNMTGCAASKASSPLYKPDDELVVIAHGLGRNGNPTMENDKNNAHKLTEVWSPVPKKLRQAECYYFITTKYGY